MRRTEAWWGLHLALLLLPSVTAYYYRPLGPMKHGFGPQPNGHSKEPPPPLVKNSRQREEGRHSTPPRCTSTSTDPSAAAAAVTTIAASPGKRKLVGAKGFVRSNPKSDRFKVLGFHHIEFYCGDATNTCRRFQLGLGMDVVAKSDLSTGNDRFASYCVKSNDFMLVFSAPYGNVADGPDEAHPGFNGIHATEFFRKHGVAARAIGLEVDDATKAYEQCISHGGQAALAPVRVQSPDGKGSMVVSEVRAYGDVVIRFVSREGGFDGPFLPSYRATPAPPRPLNYGIQRIDHAVGNVWDLVESLDYVAKMTGFHEFAEFTAEDVGTVESGLNSVVLANNNERVLLPLNEPTYGTKRKSQIQTYLEQNQGPGLQHLALSTADIFETVAKMREMGELGGFEFQERPSEQYYRDLPGRIGDSLTAEQYRRVEELGLLADKDDQGVLLQVFTKPVSDRPTFFIEIIQRIGCMEKDPETGKMEQKGGCGGFGKGNFKALFESVERYEAELFKDK